MGFDKSRIERYNCGIVKEYFLGILLIIEHKIGSAFLMENKWYDIEASEVARGLNSDIENGLNLEDVNKKRDEFGFNELRAGKKKSLVVRFLEQFKDFMIIVLIISAIVSGFVGIANGEGITDTIIIMFVIILNAIIGVAQESKAEKSLEALKKLSSHMAKVIRNGKLDVIPSKELVPGDIVVLETGDFVPADLRIIEAHNLKAQEASLTGESLPVDKMSDIIEGEKVGIGDRSNMLFSSSLITYGRGKAIVVETGMNTEVGKIADMMNSSLNTETPLQKKLNQLGKTLGIFALIICVLIFVVGLINGKEIISMFMTAVTLAVAAIPEGLPAVSTIVLAIGVQRMVKKNAIVKNLPSVETLGSASVICSDKTGTLTQNKMTVQKVFANGTAKSVEDIKELSSEERKLIEIGMLCNDTKVSNDNEFTGDPTETALTDIGFKLGYNKEFLNIERQDEIPFDSDRKLMTIVIEKKGKYLVYTKGAVDELLKRCGSYALNGEVKSDLENYVNTINEQNKNMASEALRVLAMAYKITDKLPSKEEMEKDLIFTGMVGMIDPPREEAKVAVQKCKNAGIKPVMITGDHKITAIAIAKKLGILENEAEAITGDMLEDMSQEELTQNIEKYSVYARVSPEHKVRIVKAWQTKGQVVAMTGDGVNDAPALKNADIGCAMGKVGTDVAKEAADVILTDDNFATVVSAVEEGRRIYDNILKSIQFLLSSNVGEIVVLFMATMCLPLFVKWFGITNVSALEVLLPIQILWINLVTDSLQALALAVDPATSNIMNRKPNSAGSDIFTKGMIWRIAYQGIMIGALTLIAYMIGLSTTNVDESTRIQDAQTMAFVVLAFSELTHVFNIRNNKESIFKTGIGGNKYLLFETLISAMLMLVILFIPALRDIFGIAMLPKENILEVIILSLAPIAIVEIFKLLKINTSKDEE